MSTRKYSVHIRAYAENHYIKTFKKKYHEKAWNETIDSIESLLIHVENIIGKRTLIEKIISCKDKHILKCEFAVAGTRESPHGSGNRYIVYMDEEQCECHILLVYCKWNYSGQETTWWKQQIKENYSDMKELFESL